MWHMIGECNYRFLDVLAGEFRGRGKDGNVRRIIGKCNCRVLDALVGEFRDRGKESNVWHIIRKCNYRFLDVLAGEFTGHEICDVLLGNAIIDCQMHWQENSEVVERIAMYGILLGNATADC